jgi:hypothetical protein
MGVSGELARVWRRVEYGRWEFVIDNRNPWLDYSVFSFYA